VVASEKSQLLQSVARQRVVGVAERQRQVVSLTLPPALAEDLADGRGGIVSPSILGEEVPCKIPVESGCLPSSVLELDRPSHVAAVHALHGRPARRQSIFGLNRESAAKGVQAEERVRAGNQRGRCE